MLIPLRHCWRFFVFALAVDRFVTIERRTAQFCFWSLDALFVFGLPPFVPLRRKSKPISPKVYAQLLNTKRKRKVHEVSKPMASLSLIPFPFALHSLSSSSSAVTRGHHKPKQGREVSYTNSSQFHKVSP